MNYSSYSYLASQLAILQPGLQHVQAVGTDGEKALHDATFTEAVPLRGLVRKLREFNVAECIIIHYMYSECICACAE